jgi:hypothetical protein
MGRFAKVSSIDALPRLAAALQKFRGEGVSALDDLEAELRRGLEWIHHERKDYWTRELRRAQDALNQARIQLQQAQTLRRVADRTPSCMDEKRAVERARRRVETAQRKLAAVHHWIIALDRAADDFRRSRSQFATWLDIDLAQAVAALNQMSETLVTYISTKSDDEPPAPEPDKDADQKTAGTQEGERGRS